MRREAVQRRGAAHRTGRHTLQLYCGAVRTEIEPTGAGHGRNPSTNVWQLVERIRERA